MFGIEAQQPVVVRQTNLSIEERMQEQESFQLALLNAMRAIVTNGQIIQERLSEIEAENGRLHGDVAELRIANEQLQTKIQQLKKETAPLRDKEFKSLIRQKINKESSSSDSACIGSAALSGVCGVLSAGCLAAAPFTLGTTAFPALFFGGGAIYAGGQGVADLIKNQSYKKIALEEYAKFKEMNPNATVEEAQQYVWGVLEPKIKADNEAKRQAEQESERSSYDYYYESGYEADIGGGDGSCCDPGDCYGD